MTIFRAKINFNQRNFKIVKKYVKFEKYTPVYKLTNHPFAYVSYRHKYILHILALLSALRAIEYVNFLPEINTLTSLKKVVNLFIFLRFTFIQNLDKNLAFF